MCDYCFTLGKCPPKWIKRVARSFQKLVISSDPTVRSDRSEVNRIQNDTTTAKVSMIVHKILAADERRKKNVVAVGIPETTDVDDREAFLQICEENLGVKPHIYAKNCVRIGKCSDTRPRPLLVKLNSEQTASDILRAARNLKKSDDAAIRQVYINPDVSPYAAKLAYEKRCKRRELKQQVVNAPEVLRTGESDATRDEQVDQPADGDTECGSNEGITDWHDDNDNNNNNDSEEAPPPPLITGEKESSSSSGTGSGKDSGPGSESSSDSTKQTFLVVRSC